MADAVRPSRYTKGRGHGSHAVFTFQQPSVHTVQHTCSTSSIFQAGPREDAFSVRGEGVWYLWSKYSYLVGFVPAPLRRPEGGRLFVRQERSVVLAPTNIPATLGWNISTSTRIPE